ncbi:hypothetical protein CJP74_07265 [Psittacicella melopsittaci]|uniref:ABM domain-containing protein n=1 Tax=Psittacicella melopsittaci TaxID=2028576 RepID=A0A3A1Y5X6_9GAMM|nr:antibiotic biosynthesis monooxygenase [Psittacicella melopsittaci]RIY31464.1 hypothetical protein CJP74_07265 [Psittacicella melopsittaci]
MLKKILSQVVLFFSCFALAQANSPLKDTPVFKVCEVEVHQGRLVDFEQISRRNIFVTMASDAGPLSMYYLRSTDNPYKAYHIEIFTNKQSYNHYLNTEYFQDYHDTITQLSRTVNDNCNLQAQYLYDKSFMQNGKNKVILVKVEIKDRYREQYRKELIKFFDEIRNSDNKVLALYAGLNNKQWVFIEVFGNEQDYQAHLSGSSFQSYLNSTSKMIKSREVLPITPLFLMSKGSMNFSINGLN